MKQSPQAGLPHASDRHLEQGAPSTAGVLNDAHAAFDITALKQLMAEQEQFPLG